VEDRGLGKEIDMDNLLRTVAAGLLFGALSICDAVGYAGERQSAAADSLGWRLGVQAYTFREFTFFEAVDKTASMGLKQIEAYPGQRVSADIDAAVDHNMDPAIREKIRQKLDGAGVKLVNYGVVTGKDEADWRRIFEFARSMGVETIVSEPDAGQMDLVESLCKEFETNLAIHNHPKPSRYWDPEKVLEAVKGRSERIGACADTGHWVRSGLDPLECLKKLDGRIKSLHLKDLNVKAPDAHDVPWGTGVSNVFGMLDELKRQGFKGVFSVEYEYNWRDSVPEISKCIDYFDLVSTVLVGEGYKDLFEKDLSNAIFDKGGWAFEGGVLAAKGKGDIWSKDRYGDFILDLEFKCDPETNSGVFLRCNSIENWLHTAVEVQILQPVEANDKYNCGAIFDCLAPSKHTIKAPGEWNRYTIITRANRIYVILNGEQVIAMDLDQWTEAHRNPDGTPNKFDYAYKDMSREGHVGLQYHGSPVRFRNVRIKPL
jgi:sugar phosphate isomerase/epimerase